MGQAFDESGRVLGEAFGTTKQEVFDKLHREFNDAAEIRIRSMETGKQQVQADPKRPLREKLDEIFKYHAPDSDQQVAYEKLRTEAKQFAKAIIELTPACADQTAAIRLVREAVMTANAAIALRGLV
jgi:hypothetical protein